jgi:putative membrane protein
MHKCKYDRENYMNPFLLVAIKLLIGFFAMVIIINISGKGNLAPTSASDQIVNYVLGGIIGGVIYNSNVKILDFIGILCIWCALVLALKWVKKHNVKAKQIIDGKALIIIDDGKIDIENCRKLGLSAHDVAFKLRTSGIYSSKDVKRAVIEQNGQLIVIKAGEENPKFPVITDGQVHADILKIIGKDEKWLLEEIKKHGVDKYSKVFLGEYVDNSLTLTTYK